uniref:Uncharacterized protein n=1 Tax=Arundo donax TaxID=35708 RepID=A0A0A9GRM9_ARUDO
MGMSPIQQEAQKLGGNNREQKG